MSNTKYFEKQLKFGKDLEIRVLNFMKKLYPESMGYSVVDSSNIIRCPITNLPYPDITIYKKGKIFRFYDAKNKRKLYMENFRPSFSVCEKLWHYRKFSKKYKAPVFLIFEHPYFLNHYYQIIVDAKPWYCNKVQNQYGEYMMAFDLNQVKRITL